MHGRLKVGIKMFTVYSNKKNNNMEPVEQGLSSGELRQALLDRFSNDIRHNRLDLINKNFHSIDITLPNEELLTHIDKILYDLTDNQLINKEWFFTHETILVKGTQNG